ncbi:MAG: O-antigen ligase family protein [Eubacteriales bacterium]|nr:O-antigen ligase family protein [Eubacteriales bacterium]
MENNQFLTGKNSILTQFSILLIFINALGLPGNFANYYFPVLDTIFSYLTFFLMFYVMIISSGDRLLAMDLLDFKKKYWSIYLLIIVFFVNSMMVTNFPREQFISCFRFSMTALFAIWLADHIGINRILDYIYYASFVISISCLLFLVINPNGAYSLSEGGFCFIAPTKNSGASIFLHSIALLFMRMKFMFEEKRIPERKFLFTIISQIIFLFMCNSIGAILGLAIVTVFVFGSLGKACRIANLNLGLIYIVVSIGFIIFALTILQLFTPVLEAIGKDATLTQRVPLWNRIIDIMLVNNTMRGWGYAMFWRDSSAMKLIHAGFNRNTWLSTLTSGAHNVIFDLWLNVGIIGLGAYFIALLDCFKSPLRLTELQYEFCGAFMIAFCSHGLMERSFTTFSYQLLFLFIVLATGCNKEEKAKRRLYSWELKKLQNNSDMKAAV